MTITAKFPGTCATCQGRIEPGQQIEWDKATKETSHSRCAVEDAHASGVVEIDRKPSFPPTAEQVEALDLFTTGESLAIEAGAGTGKTTTLRLLAESTRARGQYIAFNKAIVTEAGAKMPSNVNCSTAHSLAYRAVGHRYKDRIHNSRRMRSIEIADRLKIDGLSVNGPSGRKSISRSFLGGLAMRAITRFCQSADPEPTHRHVPHVEGIDEPGTYGNNDEVARALVPALRRAWADLMSENGVLPFKHDHYLKAWQLDGPRIGADFILFDEAQDANPVMVAIVTAQTHAQLVWVGDSQQQIYTFTGAVNALGNVPAESRAMLTQSFRFGPAIAEVANRLLDRLAADLRLVGTDAVDSTVAAVPDPDAILTRTNAAAVHIVLRLQASGKRVALVGGGDEVVRFAKAAAELMRGEATEHPDLACFDNWGEVRAYVDEDEQGSELRLLVSLVEEFGVEAILEALDRTMREDDADVIVSTAHKSKGREWDSVQLSGDFQIDKPSPDELRLLYVACTRAKRELDIEAIEALWAPVA